MKKTFKYLAIGVGGLVLLFIFLANFSVKEINYKCSGDLSQNDEIKPIDIYIKLRVYRPWVGLWGDSAGSLNWELDNGWVGYYGYLQDVGDQLHIYETYRTNVFKGRFSKLSNNLAMDLGSSMGFFNGACNQR